MPIGSNQGRQNNVLLFEAGYIYRTSDPDVERVVTLAVHPVVVAPQSISYADNSRSPVTQTLDRSSRLVTSRANRVVQISGMFGVEERGYAAYRGTGYVRWQRFYNEVVRWSDCRNQAALDDLINDLTGSPLIRLRLQDFDPGRCSPFVNFYDLWNNRHFTVNIDGWSDNIQSRQGGATGNRGYSLRLMEAGPIIASQFADVALETLFSGQQLFKDAIGVLQSYDESAMANSLLSVPTTVLSAIGELTGVVATRAEKARSLFGGTRRTTVSPAVVSFLGEGQALIGEIQRAADAAAPSVGPVDPPPGYIHEHQWLTLAPDAFAGIVAEEQLGSLYTLQAATLNLLRMGAFFGISQTEYADIIATGGASQRSVPLSTTQHTVTSTDTPASLERTYGTTFGAILQASQMLPDEALFPGALLTIPLQQSTGPRFISGLPVFGSQVDSAAWGSDLALDLADDGDGDFLIVRGADVLVQGVRFIEEQEEAQMMDLAQSAGDASQVIVGAKLTQSLLSDRRIASVPQIIVAAQPQEAAIQVDIQVTPINARSPIAVGVR